MTTLPGFTKCARFAAVLRQSEGCDYTIGCGVKIVRLAANTEEDAVTEARALLREYRQRELGLNSMQILALAGTADIPVKTWYREFNEEDADSVAATQRLADYAELKRLHEKMGLPPPPPLDS